MSGTTIRVSIATRDALQMLAQAEGVSIGEMLRRMTRRERQRLMGLQDAQRGVSDEETAIVAGAAHQVGTVIAEEERARRRHHPG